MAGTAMDQVIYNFTNGTNMSIIELESPCGINNGTTPCKKEGLGISLSTPILMFSCGLLGNVLALVVLYTSKNDVKKTAFFILLAGLAWTDLIGQIMTSPMAIIVYANNLQWVGGQPTCIFHAFVMINFAILTPVLVCTMSVDRLIALQFSFFYARTFTQKKAKIAIVICWMAVLFFCSWPLMGFGSYEQQFPGSWCFLNFHKESVNDIAYATIFSVINIVFISTNLVCNIITTMTLLQMRKKRIIQNSPSMDRRQGALKVKSQKRLESETQMVVFLCAITLVFSTCHLPLNVNILVNQITGATNSTTDLLSIRMASINQILDPWLYILLRRRLFFKIAKRIKKIICGMKTKTTHKIKAKSKYSYDNKGSDHANSYVLGSIGNHEVKIVYNNQSSDSEGTGSHESLGSTSNLLPGSHNDVRIVPQFQRSNSEDNRTSAVIKIQTNTESDSENDRFDENLSESFRSTIAGQKKRKISFPNKLSNGNPKKIKRQNSSPAKLECYHKHKMSS